MKFSHSLIAAAILSALTSIATAQDISLKATVNNANDLSQFNETLASTTSPVTVNAENKAAMYITTGGDYTVDGLKKDVTFQFTGSNTHNGGVAMRFGKDSNITFKDFTNLTFIGKEYKKEKSTWILGQKTQFGSSQSRLENLTFTDVELSTWLKDSDISIDVFAENFSTNQAINVNTNNLTLNFNEIEEGTFDGSQNFGAGIKTAANKSVTINGGDISVGSIDGSDDAIYAVSDSNLTINGQSLTTGTKDVSSTGGIRSDGITYISTAKGRQSVINGNIYVGKNGQLNWTKGGDVTINGNIRNDGGLTSFGQRDGESLTSLTINGTNPNETSVYPNGFTTANSYVGADTFKLYGTLIVTGDTDIKSSNATFNSYDNQEGIHIQNGSTLHFLSSGNDQILTIESKNKPAISINGNDSSIVVESGQLNITGGVASSAGTINFGTSENQLSSISIKSNGSTNNYLSLGNGTKANLYSSGDIKIAGDVANAETAITLSGAESQLNLVAATLADIDGAVVINSGNGTFEGSTIDISGYLYNRGGNVSLKGKNITVATPENANYGYYMGIHSSGTTTINSDALNVYGGINISSGKFDVISSSAIINATGRNALSASNSSEFIFNAVEDTENQTLVLNSTDAGAALISSKSKLSVKGGNFQAIGSVQSNGGIIELGTANKALNSVIVSSNKNGASALRSNGGDVSVFADQVAIVNEGKTAIDAFTYQRDTSLEGDTGTVRIHGNKTVNIIGDIVAGKDSNELDRDYVRENSVIEIDSDGTTQIAGNLFTFNSDSYKTGGYDENNPQSGITSGKTNNVIKLTLNGSTSSLTGSIVDEGATDKTGTSLNLTDGASWNLTDNSTLNTVVSDGGFINTDGNQLTTNTLINQENGTTLETSSGRANQIHISQVEGNGLDIHLTDEATQELDANNPEKSLAAVANIENSDSGYIITSDEAGVLGDMQLVMDENGNVVNFTEKANTVNEGLQDIAASNYLFFRSSMNDVNKRMGDLRSMPKSAGAWARYYGGEMKYGDMNMETTYNTLQVGADGWIDNFYLGVSASISDGNGDLDNGSVDNRNYNFGVYGGWVADNGQFVDVIVKRHRMETDGHLSSTSGTHNAFDYYNWGTSVSVEYGWRFNCPSTNFWVEPQAELLYGRMDSVDFRTSQGARVDQDAVDSLIGRLGASVGYTFDQNRGSAYFKASVLHDWKGETESDVTAGGATRSFHDDLGGTWGEFALGGTYNVTDSFSAYGDVLTTTGSPVRNPWQISVGVRYTF